jgi:hypothetical protein
LYLILIEYSTSTPFSHSQDHTAKFNDMAPHNSSSIQGGKTPAKVGWHLRYGSGEARACRPLTRQRGGDFFLKACYCVLFFSSCALFSSFESSYF